MSGVPSAKTSRAPTASLNSHVLISFAATLCARTTPATLLRSAMPSPARPKRFAPRDQLLRIRGAAQEGEIGGDGQLGIAGAT